MIRDEVQGLLPGAEGHTAIKDCSCDSLISHTFLPLAILVSLHPQKLRLEPANRLSFSIVVSALLSPMANIFSGSMRNML